MMNATSPEILYRQLLDADEAGVRLEVVMGNPTWEFHPSPAHQNALRDIVRSIQPTGGDQQGANASNLPTSMSPSRTHR